MHTIYKTVGNGPSGETTFWLSPRLLRSAILFSIFCFFAINLAKGQTPGNGCTPTKVVQAITNGNFDQGLKGFNIGQSSASYKYINPPGYSSPGTYQVNDNDSTVGGQSVSTFNQAFSGVYDMDYKTSGGTKKGNMLLIDQAQGDQVSWYTTVDVIPGQVYYFSAWVTELDKQGNNAILQFEIIPGGDPNGTPIKIGSEFTASDTWTQTFATWNSGTNTKAILRITDVQGQWQQGNDYALDNISFSNGCNNIQTPNPTVGNTSTLCTEGTVPLNSNLTGTHTWYLFPAGSNTGTVISGQTGPTIQATQPGTYEACVVTNNPDAPNCPVTTSIDVTATMKADLGPDTTVCMPPQTFKLDPKITGSKLSYTWSNSSGVISGATGPTYTATLPSTYKVTVHSAVSGCTDATDDIKVSSYPTPKTPVATYCNGVMKIDYTGVPDGQYVWYTRQDNSGKALDGTVVNPAQLSYTASDLTTLSNDASGNAIYTIYADDKTVVNTTVGPTAKPTCGQTETSGSQAVQSFTVSKDFNLSTVKFLIEGYSSADINGSIVISKSPNLTSPVYTAPFTVPVAQVSTTTPTEFTATVNYDFTNSTGQTYYIGFANTNAKLYYYSGCPAGTFTYPYKDAATGNIVSITGGNYNSAAFDNKTFGILYDWTAKTGTQYPCGRVPVSVTYACPPCKSPMKFKVLPTTGRSMCTSTATSIALSIDTTGANNPDVSNTTTKKYEFAWYKADATGKVPAANQKTPLSSAMTYTVNAAAPQGSGLYVVRMYNVTIDNSLCYLDSVIDIEFQTPILQKSIFDNDTICEGSASSKAFGASSTPTGGKTPYAYQWESSATAGGTYTNITGATAQSYSPGSPASTLYFKRVVSGGLCPSSTSDSAYIVVDPKVTAGSIQVASSPICQFNAPTLSELTPATGGLPTLVYKWQIDSSFSATPVWKDLANSNSKNLANAPQLNTIGTYNFERVVISGKCSATTAPVAVTTIKAMNPGQIQSDQNICYNMVPADITNKALATGGTGPDPHTYTYSWQVSTDGLTFQNIAGATDPSKYTSGKLISDTYFRRQAIVLLPAGTTPTRCDTGQTKAVKIKVYDPLNAGKIKTDTIICSGRGLLLESIQPATGGSPGRIYGWKSSTSASGPFTDLSPAAAAENFNSGALTSTIYYQRTAHDPQCGDSVSNVYKVAVLPIHVPKVTMTPPSSSICELDKNILFNADTTGAGKQGKFYWYLDGNIQTQSNNTDSVRLSNWHAPKATIKVKIVPGNDYLCYAGPDSTTATVQIISAQNATIDLLGDSVICEGDSVPFITRKGLSSANDTYVWKLNGTVINGAKGDNYGIKNLKDGDVVRVDFASGSHCANPPKTASDSIKMSVYEYPKVTVTQPPVDTICEGQPYPLVGSGNFTTTKLSTKIQWYKNNQPIPGATSLNLNAKDSGTYYMVMTNGPCADTSTRIPLVTQKIEVFAGQDHEMYIKEIYIPDATLKLNGQLLNNPGSINLSWSPVDTTIVIDPTDILHPKISPGVPTRYTLVGTTSIGCTDTSTVLVTVYLPIWIPNVFSPNSDGLNDTWMIDGLYSYPKAIVRVFNRWGNVVYESSGYPQGKEWDGKTNDGDQLPVATYYYIVDPNVSREPPQKGYVVILR